MKQIHFRLRTTERVDDWLDLASQIKRWDPAPRVRINGKQKNTEGFYTSVRCNVDAGHLIDAVTEILAYVEKKPANSFDVIVDEVGPTNNGSQVSRNKEPDQ